MTDDATPLSQQFIAQFGMYCSPYQGYQEMRYCAWCGPFIVFGYDTATEALAELETRMDACSPDSAREILAITQRNPQVAAADAWFSTRST